MVFMTGAVWAQSASEILNDLEKLRVLGSVLYVAAHPDDENTKLIAHLARKERYQTAYLSLTRGDGGQNLIGPELGPDLGVIRTQELLQARALDGGQQYFSRALDFGYSKSPEETLAIWDRDQVLADTVWVIRQFQPDVLINRFALEPGYTHGHHTASAQLALEAFEAAADPRRFPEQLEKVAPWQAKRILWNLSPWHFRQRGLEFDPKLAEVEILVSGFNSLLGASIPEIAARSRSQHKSQGFGAAPSGEEQREYLQNLAGPAPKLGLMDGVDPTWNRIPGGQAVDRAISDLIRDFEPREPALTVPRLLAVRDLIDELPSGVGGVWPKRKRDEIESLIEKCLGLRLRANTGSSFVEPGTEVPLSLGVLHRYPGEITLTEVSIGEDRVPLGQSIPGEVETVIERTVQLPKSFSYDHPYWLKQQPTEGMFEVADLALRGVPENPPDLEVQWTLSIDGRPLVLRRPWTYARVDPVHGEVVVPVSVAPKVSVECVEDMVLFPGPEPRLVEVRVRALQGEHQGGVLTLMSPSAWGVVPENHQVPPMKQGAKLAFQFEVTPGPKFETVFLQPELVLPEGRFDRTVQVIEYPHIPRQVSHPRTQIKAVAVDLLTSKGRVGYISGAGDKLPQALKQMGYQVEVLDPAALTVESLKDYRTVVLGVRALNVLEGLETLMPTLFAFVHQGGTLVVNYNTSQSLKREEIAPYSLKLSRGRVTDQNSKVRLLNPEHPVLRGPNRLEQSDFEGWVQERGLYFAQEWGPEFTPILGMHDPGEDELTGGLLVAPYGSGQLIYTGLSFFRQLPAGVPGAYRLFANLVDLRHE